MCYQETSETVTGYTVGLIDTIWPIIFVFIVTILFWIFRKKIRDTRARVVIPYLLLGFMVLFEIQLFITLFSSPFVPICDTMTNLPLHLCATSAVMIMVYLVTRKDIVLEILFLQGIAGALVTFIFPSTTSFPYEYDYWRFFLSHTLLFIVPMYYFIVEGFRPNKRTLIIAFIAAHIFAAIATTVNLIIDHNYMYILPDNERNLFHFIPIHNAIPFFGRWPGVILFGELLIFPVYFALYGIIRFIGSIMDKKEEVK